MWQNNKCLILLTPIKPSLEPLTSPFSFPYTILSYLGPVLSFFLTLCPLNCNSLIPINSCPFEWYPKCWGQQLRPWKFNPIWRSEGGKTQPKEREQSDLTALRLAAFLYVLGQRGQGGLACGQNKSCCVIAQWEGTQQRTGTESRLVQVIMQTGGSQ